MIADNSLGSSVAAQTPDKVDHQNQVTRPLRWKNHVVCGQVLRNSMFSSIFYVVLNRTHAHPLSSMVWYSLLLVSWSSNHSGIPSSLEVRAMQYFSIRSLAASQLNFATRRKRRINSSSENVCTVCKQQAGVASYDLCTISNDCYWCEGIRFSMCKPLVEGYINLRLRFALVNMNGSLGNTELLNQTFSTLNHVHTRISYSHTFYNSY